jgi:hypothetical protein
MDIAPNRNITYYGTLTSASDQRLKTDIQDVSLEDCQTVFDSLTPKTYKRRDQTDGKYRLGILAQDLKRILPARWDNLVDSFMHGPEDGAKEEYLSVSYDRLSLCLWGVVKNQQKALRELTLRIDALEAPKKKTAKK